MVITKGLMSRRRDGTEIGRVPVMNARAYDRAVDDGAETLVAWAREPRFRCRRGRAFMVITKRLMSRGPDGTEIGRVPVMNAAAYDRPVDGAAKTFKRWRFVPAGRGSGVGTGRFSW